MQRRQNRGGQRGCRAGLTPRHPQMHQRPSLREERQRVGEWGRGEEEAAAKDAR